MIDLSTSYAGLSLKNPLVVGGGPNAATPRICEKAAKAGWAGVVLKVNPSDEAIEKLFVDPQMPMRKSRPFYKLLDATGVRKWKPIIPKVRGKRPPGKPVGPVLPKDYQLTVWNQNTTSPTYKAYAGMDNYYVGDEKYLWYINKAKELCEPYDCKVIANVTAYTEEGWEQEVKLVNKSKADAVEVVLSCPLVGVWDPRTEKIRRFARLDIFPELVEKFTKFYIDRSDKPVSVKLPPDYMDVMAPIRAAIKGGAKSIQFGDCPIVTPPPPPLIVDTETLEVGLFPGAPYGGALTQCWGIPYICGALARFRLNGIDADIAGCGSVRDYTDVLRLIMCGATSVQMATTPLVEGVGIAEGYLNELTTWMERKNYNSIKEFQGIVANEEKLKIDTSKFESELALASGGPLPSQKVLVSEKRCINCGWCEACCPEVAITIPDKIPVFDDEFCEVCGMCVAVCPTEALSIVPRS